MRRAGITTPSGDGAEAEIENAAGLSVYEIRDSLLHNGRAAWQREDLGGLPH